MNFIFEPLQLWAPVFLSSALVPASLVFYVLIQSLLKLWSACFVYAVRHELTERLDIPALSKAHSTLVQSRGLSSFTCSGNTTMPWCCKFSKRSLSFWSWGLRCLASNYWASHQEATFVSRSPLATSSSVPVDWVGVLHSCIRLFFSFIASNLASYCSSFGGWLQSTSSNQIFPSPPQRNEISSRALLFDCFMTIWRLL